MYNKHFNDVFKTFYICIVKSITFILEVNIHHLNACYKNSNLFLTGLNLLYMYNKYLDDVFKTFYICIVKSITFILEVK